MNEEKKCPLLSMVGLNSNGVPCAEEGCAWWDSCQCVLCSIAKNLEDVAVNTMELKNLDELPVRLKN